MYMSTVGTSKCHVLVSSEWFAIPTLPSNDMKAKFDRAVKEGNVSIFHHEVNEVKTNVNMFGAAMILVIASESNRGLIVVEQRNQLYHRSKDLQDRCL